MEKINYIILSTKTSSSSIWNSNNTHKCNLCQDREEGPACKQACSKRAIELVDIEDLKDKKQNAHVAKLQGLSKRPKRKGVLSLITSTTKAKTAADKESEWLCVNWF